MFLFLCHGFLNEEVSSYCSSTSTSSSTSSSHGKGNDIPTNSDLEFRSTLSHTILISAVVPSRTSQAYLYQTNLAPLFKL